MPSIYQNTVGNLTVQIWFRYQPPYWISGSIEETTLRITITFHATYNDYSCHLINIGGITPLFECYLNSRYIGPQGQSGNALRGLPGHLPGLGRQLPEN